MLTCLIIVFVVLAVAELPVAFALGGAAVLAVSLFSDIPLAAIPHKMINGINSYIFIAIPLFLLAGRLMNAGGITDRIFGFARALVGSFYGGLAQANVIASMIFAWMSGSAVATVGGLGEIEVKTMKDNGYPVPFAAALASASSCLGPVIPPSIPLIIYGAMTEVSIGRLFLGSILPGLALGLALMVTVYLISRKRGFPRDPKPTRTRLYTAAKDAVWSLLMPALVLGGLAAGWFTATEAAAVAAVYALLLSMLVYRSVKIRDLPRILVETMVTTSVVTFIISTSSAFSFLLAVESAGERIAALVLDFSTNPIAVLLLFNLLLLALGAVMEAGVVLILFTPILYPIAISVGVDPVHFGVIMVVNLMIGVATPPVGVSLFVMSHISGVKLETLMREILKFLFPLFVVLALITYWPQLSLALPAWLMK